MARCFPYMPPEVSKDCAAAAAAVIGPSVGSIKLQSERSDRKQKKKEKKEKKREKDRKEKSEGLHDKSQQMRYQSKKRKHDEMGQLNNKDDRHAGTSSHAMEPIEKSGVTEENGMPCSTANPGDSSDSTQDCTKRKKLADPTFSHNNGLVLRLKLSLKNKDELPPPRCEQPCFLQTQPLQKHSDLSAQTIRESGTTSAGEPCFSGRVVEMPLLQRHPKQDERYEAQLLLTASNEHHLFSDVIMKQTHEVAGSHSRSEKRSRSKSKEKKRHLREFILNWNPPLQCEEEVMGDQDWLFRTRDNCCRTSIAEVRDNESGMSSLQPQGQYLPQFNICALPFVVPF